MKLLVKFIFLAMTVKTDPAHFSKDRAAFLMLLKYKSIHHLSLNKASCKNIFSLALVMT